MRCNVVLLTGNASLVGLLMRRGWPLKVLDFWVGLI